MLKSYCYLLYRFALWSNLSRHTSGNLLSVIITHSNDLLMFQDAHAPVCRHIIVMNSADHIQVVIQNSAYSLISRVTTSLRSIVTAIVNIDAYLQSPLLYRRGRVCYVIYVQGLICFFLNVVVG